MTVGCESGAIYVFSSGALAASAAASEPPRPLLALAPPPGESAAPVTAIAPRPLSDLGAAAGSSLVAFGLASGVVRVLLLSRRPDDADGAAPSAPLVPVAEHVRHRGSAVTALRWAPPLTRMCVPRAQR